MNCMSQISKHQALEALERIFNNCEEIDYQGDYEMLDDINLIRDFIYHVNIDTVEYMEDDGK